MSTVLVIPTDGQQLDHLNHALETWRVFGPPIDHVIVVGEVTALKGTRTAQLATLWPVPQLQRQVRLNNQRNLASVLGKNWSNDVTFIWSHDDIFLTKPFNLKQLTQITRYGLKKQKPARSLSRVAQATELTLVMLAERGKPAVNYELHLPTVIRPVDREGWVKWMPRNDALQFRSWILNHLEIKPLRLIEDVKIFSAMDKLPALGIYSTAPDVDPRPLRTVRG